MKILAPLLLLLLALSAYGGESFEDRVQRANDLEKTATSQCVPEDPDLEGQAITLVLTVSTDGSPRDIEVQPSTKAAKCIASKIARAPFPKPSEGFSASGLPLVFVLHLHMHAP